MADAITLSRLGMSGYGNNYGGGYNGAFDEFPAGGSLADSMSIWSGGYMPTVGGYGMGGYPYGMGGYPYGTSGAPYGMTPAEYEEWKNLSTEEKEAKLAELQERRMRRNSDYQEKMADIQEKIAQRTGERQLNRQLEAQQRQNYIQGPLKAAQATALDLKTVILENRKDEVLTKWSELKAQIAKLPGTQKRTKQADGTYMEEQLEEKELNALAREFYSRTMGSDVIKDINDNLAGSFTQGLKKGFSLGGLGDKEDADTLKENILGLKRDGSNIASRTAGRALGGAATGAAAGAGIGAIFGGIGAVPGAFIGGALGGLGGLISSIF